MKGNGVRAVLMGNVTTLSVITRSLILGIKLKNAEFKGEGNGNSRSVTVSDFRVD
jgi:hypothetical protein